MTEFYIGQIFENEYPIEAAQWCNDCGNCYIKEIDGLDGKRCFEIVETLPPSEEELKEWEIAQIKAQLQEVDLKSIRAIRAGETDYILLYEEQAEALRQRLASLT